MSTPSFKGNAGKVVGGLLGFVAGAVTATIFAGPAVVAGVFAVAGANWGDKQEEDIKKELNNDQSSGKNKKS